MDYPCLICNNADFKKCQCQSVDERFGRIPWRQRPKKISFHRGNLKSLNLNGPGAPGIWDKFDEALAGMANHRVGRLDWDDFAEKYADKDLAEAQLDKKMLIIDAIWNEIIKFHPYGTPVSGMVDPGAGNFPSSPRIRTPVFSQRGICYRCDKRKPDEVLAQGFKPAFSTELNPPEAIKDTIMERCTANGADKSAGFWIDNRDIVNETSICVSRTLKGCGKFPNPQDKGLHYFFAFKFNLNKQGFDTEAEQVRTGGRWLPGEKAFASIDTNEVVAWCMIDKLGSDTNNAAFNTYSYRLVNNYWTFVGSPGFWERTYLTAELDFLTEGQNMRTITIHKNQDFVSGQ